MINLFLIISLVVSTYGSSLIKEYPSNFNDALEYKKEIENILIEKDIREPEFYISLIFPELMRYNSVSDKLETWGTKLKYGYLNEYDGYSIGHFQIKPAFAEKIELYLKSDKTLKKKYQNLLNFDRKKDIKIQRIERLCEYQYEVLYLTAFTDICCSKYNIDLDDKKNAVKYISAIYNCGFFDELTDYEYALNQEQFTINKLSNKKWNYSKLCLYFYELFSNN